MIFFLIDKLSFAPISRTYDANNIASMGKPHRENSTINLPKAIEPFLGFTVTEITGNCAMGVDKRKLRFQE